MMVEQAVAIVRQALVAYRFACNSETDLQEAVASVLREAGVPFDREYRLGPRDRVDFLIDGSVAVELKIDGSFSEVLRQLHRYSEHDTVKALVLVTTRAQHRAMPPEMNGKRVDVIHTSTVFG